MTQSTSKATVCLWFDRDAEDAARFYAATFPDSAPRSVQHAPADFPGGKEGACGWCQDRWGISWQITPIALTQGMADPDPATRKRVFQAMMTMRKIDIAGIEAARRG